MMVIPALGSVNPPSPYFPLYPIHTGNGNGTVHGGVTATQTVSLNLPSLSLGARYHVLYLSARAGGARNITSFTLVNDATGTSIPVTTLVQSNGYLTPVGIYLIGPFTDAMTATATVVFSGTTTKPCQIQVQSLFGELADVAGSLSSSTGYVANPSLETNYFTTGNIVVPPRGVIVGIMQSGTTQQNWWLAAFFRENGGMGAFQGGNYILIEASSTPTYYWGINWACPYEVTSTLSSEIRDGFTDRLGLRFLPSNGIPPNVPDYVNYAFAAFA